MDKLIRDHRWLCSLVCLAFAGAIAWWLVRGGGDVGGGMFKVCIAGMAFCFFAAVECLKVGGALQRQAKFPNEPWLWRDDWARGEVAFSTFSNVAMRWALVLLVAVVFYGFAFLIGHFVGNEFYTHWSVWALNAFVLGFVIYASVGTRRWLRQGRSSTFRLGTIPGRIGGKLTGVVNFAQRSHSSSGYDVRLECFRIVPKGDDSELRLEHTFLSVEPLPAVPQNAGRNRLDLPLTFQIPAGVPPTGGDESVVEWMLTVKSHDPRDDFEVNFGVPVFA